MEDNRLSELPDVIIQHIQSFLRTREAARTILVSKSWLQAWSTRPYLNFHLEHFSRRNSHTLIKLIDKTLESYVEQGLSILKLQLNVDTMEERWLQNNVIELHLNSKNEWKTNLWTEIFLKKSLQVLRVLFGACPLVLPSGTDTIKCLNLKKLELHWLQIDEATFQHIISSCPLIEELLLRDCSLFNFRASNHEIQSCPFMFGRGCASLKRLLLKGTRINQDQLQTILSKSPQLEDLTLSRCYNLVKQINLSNVSLKRAKFVMPWSQIIIDAPNVQKLKFHTIGLRIIPFPVTIKSPITKGMVKVTIVYGDPVIDESWFHRFREFISKFAKSNVKFTLYYDFPMRFTFKVLRATPPSARHKVETLMFKEWFRNLPTLYAFFTICHPKIVLLGHLDSPLASLKELYKDLSYRENLECCKIDQNKCWRHYIKGAKLYYMVDKEQKPLDVNGLDTGFGKGEAISLALEWKSSD